MGTKYYDRGNTRVKVIDDEQVVRQSSSSTWSYGSYPETLGDNFTGAAGTNDNDVVYTSPDVTYANNVLIECTAATVDIQITGDGTNWRTVPTTSFTAAGTKTADDVELVATEHGVLLEEYIGKFSQFRILQKGATAANARGRYGVS